MINDHAAGMLQAQVCDTIYFLLFLYIYIFFSYELKSNPKEYCTVYLSDLHSVPELF